MRSIRWFAFLPWLAAPLAAQTPVPPAARPAPPTAPAPATSGLGACFGSRPVTDDTGNGVKVEGVTEGARTLRVALGLRP